MNILFMNSARTWGGTEKWTHMAAEAISKKHKTFLVYRRNIVGERFTIPGFRLPCLSHIDLYTVVRLVHIIQKKQIDIIIPTKRKDYLMAGLAGKITGKSVILRLGADRKLLWPWQRFMYHTLTDGIIVNAKKIKETLLETGYIPQEKIRVIYNGLDTAEIEGRILEPINKPFPFVISALGRITRNKGFDFLIRSFARFLALSGAKNAGLVIIGEGTDRQEFEILTENLGITDKVLFTGFLQNPFPLIAISDIFAMVSTNEGLSNALLEAMYLCCPPLSTYAGGVREVITDNKNGFLFDYGDEEALATLLLQLYRDERQRIQLGKNARETVLRKFSIPVMTQEIMQFCRETIERHPGKDG
ncbi:glycosyltransferase [Pelodictyon phaeoclathratiforme]|jgi:glycosyltransferase involved in cell wall biosynthesis|uniref:Glycosyl transferase group 1 n=1 Tax=Pelodictyon phaeoclathratiforme (strain DSM 5477 / BU-1) TaxID=324925 RepID=B4SCD8_PELPB|nr:glycosyltransferase [Pelodictyon phaeoclathratiforme]ACF42718.1 glycosyl transferase group 1 [Pelodictyon phaeoclathratiforme BU-1]MBV5288491.1 glycosyltransferase [Pelodictyon phaeoclathratiforme]